MLRRICRLALLAPFAALLLPLAASDARAAVALCMPMIHGEVVEASNEREARRGAMQSWLRLAAHYGVAYTRYQIAFDRDLSCERVVGGAFRCQTSGRPCTISQVPHPELPVIQRGPRPSSPDEFVVSSVQVGAAQSN